MKGRLQKYMICLGISLVLAAEAGGTGFQVLTYADEADVKEESIQQADPDTDASNSLLPETDQNSYEEPGKTEGDTGCGSPEPVEEGKEDLREEQEGLDIPEAGPEDAIEEGDGLDIPEAGPEDAIEEGDGLDLPEVGSEDTAVEDEVSNLPEVGLESEAAGPVVEELAQVSKTLAEDIVVQVSAGTSFLSNLLNSDPKLYNNDLACVAAILSQKAYDAEELKNYLLDALGFSEENIQSYNYDRSYAYTIATAPYVGEDAKENSQILVLDIRGSATIKEFINDSISRGVYPHLDQKVYGVVDTFYNELKDNLYQLLNNKYMDYRILVTGHSLGGATANLAAAHMIDEGNENVFCYTFGAIDSIVASEPVTEGFENIHNVYNDYDTFSPYQYGSILINGAGGKYGKFGCIHDYSIDHRTEEQKKGWAITQIYEAVNHSVKRYVEDMENGAVGKKSAFAAMRKNNTAQEVSAAADQDQRSEQQLLGLLFPENPEAVYFHISDKKESFTDYIHKLADTAMFRIIASLQTDYLNCGDAKVLSADIIKTPDEKTFVMIDIQNNGNQELKAGIDGICVNGVDAGREEAVSDAVGRDQHMILIIAVEQLMDQKALDGAGITSMDELSFVLHLYGEDGESLITTEKIVLPLSTTELS